MSSFWSRFFDRKSSLGAPPAAAKITPAPAPTVSAQTPAPSPSPKAPFAALIALLGASATAIVVPLVVKWEGTEYVPYKDIVGVWTVCNGDTYDVVPGKRADKEECQERLERQLINHSKPVLKCVPTLHDRPSQLAASVSLAYNIGTGGYCKSTAARLFNERKWREGCNAMLLWNKAGGRVVPGLVNRRKGEYKICITGLE